MNSSSNPTDIVLAEITLLGGRLPVERFVEAGVNNRLVEPEEALQVALELGQRLAEGAPEATEGIAAFKEKRAPRFATLPR